MVDLDLLEKVIIDFAKKSGDEAYANWDTLETEYHDDGVDLTTNFDKKIETEFRDLIQAIHPDHGIIGEEYSHLNKKSEYTWYIDPIDGSKYYEKQIPLWAVNLSLYKDDVPLLAVIYNPVTKQLARARQGKGAYLNDKKLEIPQQHSLSKMKIAFENNLNNEEYLQRQEQFDTSLHNLLSKVYRVRMLGCASQTLVWLAHGYFDAFVIPFCTTKNLLDIAAGKLIVLEAGGYMHSVRRTDVIDREVYSVVFGTKDTVNTIFPLLA